MAAEFSNNRSAVTVRHYIVSLALTQIYHPGMQIPNETTRLSAFSMRRIAWYESCTENERF